MEFLWLHFHDFSKHNQIHFLVHTHLIIITNGHDITVRTTHTYVSIYYVLPDFVLNICIIKMLMHELGMHVVFPTCKHESVIMSIKKTEEIFIF
jgi:hypothetical protein